MNNPSGYNKAHPHIHEPVKPITLSQKLRWLAAQRQKASTWWAAEVSKLILPAEQLEVKVVRMAWQGLLAGIIIGLTLAWYIAKL